MAQSNTIQSTMALTSTPEINHNWTITNNSEYEVAVMKGFSNDDLHSEQLYEQTLTLLTTVEAGKTGSVELNDTYKDANDNSHDVTSYNIIIARNDNLFPVKVIALELDRTKREYPAAEVAKADYPNMVQAQKFKKAITAFPTAKLATSFADALQEEDLDDFDAYFFGATQEYKHVTLNMVVAVSTYYETFPFVWTDYGESKTYYLYSSDGGKVSYAGKVSLENGCSAPVNLDKKNTCFSMTYEPSEGSSLDLYYVDGQFVESTETDSPEYCLTGMFILQSQLTKKAADKDVISYLTGTINGQKVIGYFEEQPVDVDNSEKEGGFYYMFHPKDFKDYADLFAYGVGLFLGLELLYKLAHLSKLKDFIWEKIKAKRGKYTPEELEKQFRETIKKITVNAEKTAVKVDAKRKLIEPDDLAQNTLEFKNQMIERTTTESRSTMNDLVEMQQKYLLDLAKYGTTPEMQKMVDTLEEVSGKLATLTDTELAKATGELTVKIKTNTTILNERSLRIKNKADTATKQELEDSKEFIEDHTSILEDSTRSREYWENQEIPEDVIIDEFVIT